MKYKVRKMVESLFKHLCFCPMFFMRTTKTDVCLHTKAIFQLNFMSNTLPIALDPWNRFQPLIQLKDFDPYDHYAACCVTLKIS